MHLFMVKFFPHSSAHVEVVHVLRLQRDAERVGAAAAVHGKDVDPILALLDELPQLPCDPAQLSLREEALINGLLAARAVALEEFPHPREAPLIADVVGNQKEIPVHMKSIGDGRGAVTKRNVAETFLGVGRGGAIDNVS